MAVGKQIQYWKETSGMIYYEKIERESDQTKEHLHW